jgi:undecaprenyl-diphosphatase
LADLFYFCANTLLLTHFLSPPYRAYLLVWLLLWIAAALLLLRLGYEGSFLALHYLRHPWMDASMPHVTHLADGLILTGLMGWLLRERPAAWWLLMATMIMVALVVAFAKEILFSDWDRPALVFHLREELFRLSTRPLLRQSFPSGHATAAAAATAIPALVGWGYSPWAGMALAAGGSLMAYSRLYIGVHFLGDIVAGSVLGVMLAWGMYAAAYDPMKRWLQRQEGRWPAWLPSIQRWLSVLLLAGGAVSVWERYYL